jgi:hypothetical protein
MTTPQPTSLLPVPVKQNELEVGGAYVEDPSFDQGDLLLPTLRLLQGISAEVQQGLDGAKPGLFWNPYTSKPIAPPVHVLVVFMAKNRWKREDNRVEPPHNQKCMSFDSINGTTYGRCSVCNYKEWTRSPKGDKPPLCAMVYVFYALTPDGPVAIRFRKAGEKAAKQALTTKVTQQKNWWTWPMLLGAKSMTGKDTAGNPTTYWSPTISWDKKSATSAEVIEMARTMSEMLMAADASGRLKTRDEEESEGDS